MAELFSAIGAGQSPADGVGFMFARLAARDCRGQGLSLGSGVDLGVDTVAVPVVEASAGGLISLADGWEFVSPLGCDLGVALAAAPFVVGLVFCPEKSGPARFGPWDSAGCDIGSADGPEVRGNEKGRHN